MFGTVQNRKKDLICQKSGAVLTFSAINNNDKVGAIFFSDKIEKIYCAKDCIGVACTLFREICLLQNRWAEQQKMEDAIKFFQ